MINRTDSLGKQIESKQALAIAYANLLLEDPDQITIGHLNILKSSLSVQQVCDITRFILAGVDSSPVRFKRTFTNVFGPCLNSDTQSAA